MTERYGERMIVTDFKECHIKEAQRIAHENYDEERMHTPILPEIEIFPDLTNFAANGLGVAAFENDRMTGFLCCFNPRERVFGSLARGCFSPIQAHGAVIENREMIYKRMYQAAAEKWTAQTIACHSIALYAHDHEAENAMFTYGFGRRCVDAVRAMEIIPCRPCGGITFEELSKADKRRIKELRWMLAEHMGKSPCFMRTERKDFERKFGAWEKEDTRVFIAKDGEELVAFAEISDEAETFAATQTADMCNLCGAFCIPRLRGRDVYQNLLNFVMIQMRAEGYNRLGVDYESFNPTANAFWPKYFSEYTHGVVRRIDECAFMG
ncbi:GNAT family N-acetyltransferase [Clostridium sp. MCC353]|uniref:GNAT family N-acetyltransferase n=1 Tax=Clostridium sp. MCC353 TaxID=2592646 RepID=UPI001C029CD1|nr:GNAT family N-acetyltransferase [Clostridium sp. MCC353]MBT9776694.1 GNAT family N-acetyltransferase [Clostridium sp. MCC353]